MNSKTLNKLNFHLGKLAQGNAHTPEGDWRALDLLVLEALSQATTPDGVRLRQLLELQAVRLPERLLIPNVYELRQELERVAKSGAHKPAAPTRPPTPIHRVADILRGRAILIVGGDPRRDHAERIRASFELAEVLWPESRETNPSVSYLEPYIARPEVALVLLLIKLNRHLVTETLPSVCDQYGKPLVRMPGGYNPEQVAAQILAQVGRRIGGD